MVSIGIDIGTTTVCACVLDAGTGEIVKTWTQPHGFLSAAHSWEKIQSVEEIAEIVDAFLKEITAAYPDIACLGLTGQMHGILYLDAEGKPVSPLMTWQDGRGNQMLPGEDETYAQRLSRLTGYGCATGYGATTHYYNVCNHLVPDGAACFCTIHDYTMMRLAGWKRPVTHPSDGASFGLFDLAAGAFDEEAIRKAGMDPAMFPAVSMDASAPTAWGFPVTVAIGDNQACFHGSVQDPRESLLVNVGTGSQISCWNDAPGCSADIEQRPYVDGGHLLSGSSLCGGRAYALLEQFFRAFLREAGVETGSAYEVMNRLASDWETLEEPLVVDTTFSGTRQDPTIRGAVRNISTENFTPAHLTAGFLQGCVNELYAHYQKMEPLLGRKPRYLVGSGNGLRKNPTLQAMFARTFGMELRIPKHLEEASYGAALFAMILTMPERDPQSIRNLISYETA